jgi:hypothetical protein
MAAGTLSWLRTPRCKQAARAQASNQSTSQINRSAHMRGSCRREQNAHSEALCVLGVVWTGRRSSCRAGGVRSRGICLSFSPPPPPRHLPPWRTITAAAVSVASNSCVSHNVPSVLLFRSAVDVPRMCTRNKEVTYLLRRGAVVAQAVTRSGWCTTSSSSWSATRCSTRS